MLREFSKELAEDRDFELGGEVFRFRYPYWEETAAIWDEDLTANENGDFSFKADTEQAIKRIPIFLDPDFNDAHKRFSALIKRKENPVPRHQITAVYRFLFQVTSGLPTNPPSDSEPGGGASGVSSPGESS